MEFNNNKVLHGEFPIALAGCGIWYFFAVICKICSENRGGKRELQLRAGAGSRVFMGLGGRNRKVNKAGYGILNSFVTTYIQKAGRNERIVRIAVSGFK